MIAVGGEDCEFYAIVLNPTGASIPELDPMRYAPVAKEMKRKTDRPGIWQKWIDVETSETGTPTKIEFKNTDSFNFAFDVVDELGNTSPEKLAMIHLSADKTERRITFSDMKKERVLDAPTISHPLV